MKPIHRVLLIALSALVCTTTYSQRLVLDVAGLRDGADIKTTNTKVYVANQDRLTIYDGERIDSYIYPTIDGGPAEIGDFFWTGNERLILAGEVPIVTLMRAADPYADLDRFVYRFEGGTFIPIPLPDGAIASTGFRLFQGRYYFVGYNAANEYHLFSIDGTTLRDELTLPPTTFGRFPFELQLVTSEQFLYIRLDRNYLLRYDGISVLRFPPLEFTHEWAIASTDLGQILDFPDTPYTFAQSYWTTTIIVYKDTTVVDVIDVPWETWAYFSYFQRLGHTVYWIMDDRSSGVHFMSHDGVTRTQIALPDGVLPQQGKIKILSYRDHVLLPAHHPDGYSIIYKYDGVNFSEFFRYPETNVGDIYERDGKILVVLPHKAYLTDGETSTEIVPESGRTLKEPEAESAACFYVWHTSDSTGTWLGRENKRRCSSEIPMLVQEYGSISLAAAARERDWCWSGIDVGWTIPPACIPPDCIDPTILTTLKSTNGKIAWQFQSAQPFSQTIPLADKKSYNLSVQRPYLNAFQEIVFVDGKLVQGGLSEVKVIADNVNDVLMLHTDTDNGAPIPIRVSLQNFEGRELWVEDVIAPFDKEINAQGKIREPVAKIVVASRAVKKNQLVAYYPNPFAGELGITVGPSAESGVVARITDLQGKLVLETKLPGEGNYTLSMKGLKEGLYILSITTPTNKETNLIELKY